jgi:hypothetical protein
MGLWMGQHGAVLGGSAELDENRLSFQANSHPESHRLSLFLTQGLKTEFPSSH